MLRGSVAIIAAGVFLVCLRPFRLSTRRMQELDTQPAHISDSDFATLRKEVQMSQNLDDLDFGKLAETFDQKRVEESALLADEHDDNHDDHDDFDDGGTPEILR